MSECPFDEPAPDLDTLRDLAQQVLDAAAAGHPVALPDWEPL